MAAFLPTANHKETRSPHYFNHGEQRTQTQYLDNDYNLYIHITAVLLVLLLVVNIFKLFL